jgi:hypothetical protein
VSDVSERWAVCFPRSVAHTALPLRLHSGIEACDVGDALWLHGAGGFENIGQLLHRIPGLTAFIVNADNSITLTGKRIPTGKLPDGPWSAFNGIVTLRPQPAALPATISTKAPISILRSLREQEPGAMLMELRQWADYAVSAPRVRLDPLRFAVCSDGRVLVVGHPLPPVPGEYFINLGGLLIPCGYEWRPRLEPAILRRAMNLHADDMALFRADTSYERVRGESFVRATRSAARRSRDRLALGESLR